MSALEDLLAPDHWSGPNGCHPDCPACAAERTPEEQAEHDLGQRCDLYCNDIVKSLRGLLSLCDDPNVKALAERFSPVRKTIFEAKDLLQKLEPKVADKGTQLKAQSDS